MEVVQGKSTNKKIILAQEIAFAKVLAGNNKTLRDRALKKLKKWLTIRGSGKWEFTEEEFLRIWTGLFYCMWMSDKFLIQEELAESISNLIHCFKKNVKSALLFIKCFNKRILMDWEGLDQYRIDKFNMLSRRFLRQTLVYCKVKNWEESLLKNLTNLFYDVVLNTQNSLAFTMHFVSIYAEELAKVGEGKLSSQTILILVEPLVKLLARTKDDRVRKESEDFFIYLMRQTDQGIEYEEKFNAWREQGYPGEGPHCMASKDVPNGRDTALENGDDDFSEEEREEESQILDPRAGSVHVVLPQLPVDADGFINLFKKHQNAKQANKKGKKLLNSLIQKFQVLKKGRFPVKVKKDPILEEKTKKKQSVKNAKMLLEFTDQIESGPIKTAQFKKLSEQLKDDSNIEDEKMVEENSVNDEDEVSGEDEVNYEEQSEESLQSKRKTLIKNDKSVKKMKKENSAQNVKETENSQKKNSLNLQKKSEPKKNLEKRKKKMKTGKAKQEGKSTQQILANQCIIVTPKKKPVKEEITEKGKQNKQDSQKTTPVLKTGMKRKILSTWQVQELDTNSPEYYKIETPKIITIETKVEKGSSVKENEAENEVVEESLSKKNAERRAETQKVDPVVAFWEKAKAKAMGRKKSKVFLNPFAGSQGDAGTPNRRISFALDRNMAQENEEYLEEVKNSPRVPFDGSKKPVQSALKSGLAPSPVNPFYRYKKIKLQSI